MLVFSVEDALGDDHEVFAASFSSKVVFFFSIGKDYERKD